MKVFIDIETLPDMRDGARDRHIEQARENVKVPSGYTKSQLGADLGMSEKEYKFISAGDLKLAWIDRCGQDKAEEVGDDSWRKTALDGSYGELLSAGYAVGDGDVIVSYRDPGDDERLFLQTVFLDIERQITPMRTPGIPVTAPRPYFIAHNARFDLTFLYRRAVVLGVKPPFTIPWDGRHSNDFYCTSQAWAGFGNRVSQNDLCAILDLDQKPDGIDGSKILDAFLDGEHERIVEYNAYDAGTVRKLYQRLTFA